MFKSLFKVAPSNDIVITKITRPVSFWVVLITFIILIFLNSFNIVHTDKEYLDILNLLILTMVGFYFTIRGAEKISKLKFNQTHLSDHDTNVEKTDREFYDLSINKNINPDKLKSF